ncbi:MAG: RNA polymerase factor sigma-54 [Acidobacteriota bacterium]
MAQNFSLKGSLNQSLSQRLAMTPSLLQKIQLLTLSRLELSELLSEELIENPVLEESPDENPSDDMLPENSSEMLELKADGKAEAGKEAKSDDNDFDYEYFFDGYLDSGFRHREYETSDKPSFEAFLVRPPSMYDHLEWLLNMSEIGEELKAIAQSIIGNLDSDGYLTATLYEIVQMTSSPMELVEEALRVVQGLEPGIAARNLQECLILQLRARGIENPVAEALIEKYLPQIQAHKYKEIARELRCDLAEISAALEQIRQLSPKPGQKFNPEEPRYIHPDVSIVKDENGGYEIVLNEDGLPKLRLNASYREMLKENGLNRDAKNFIKEKVRAAIDLLKSVDQRKQTIYRVCSCVVQRQREFLESGITALRPMLIKDVADELGVHSSTISRVVTNKYVYTPQGVMELRSFFTVGVESSEGDSLSISHVKHKIKEIIGREDPKKPLSDHRISETLNREGVQITRRTVAKYRDQLNISGSRERKMTVSL